MGAGLMGRSARVLGWEFGQSAREMNALLKEHGYLDGEPGAYGLTEKGERYAEEQYHSRGTGGYSHYNRDWETRTWSDETAAALKADIQAEPEGPDLEAAPTEDEDVLQYGSFVDYGTTVGNGSSEDEDPELTWKELAVGGAIIGSLLVAPHIKPFWNERLKPAVKKVRDKLTMRGPVEAAPLDATESLDNGTAAIGG